MFTFGLMNDLKNLSLCPFSVLPAALSLELLCLRVRFSERFVVYLSLFPHVCTIFVSFTVSLHTLLAALLSLFFRQLLSSAPATALGSLLWESSEHLFFTLLPRSPHTLLPSVWLPSLPQSTTAYYTSIKLNKQSS